MQTWIYGFFFLPLLFFSFWLTWEKGGVGDSVRTTEPQQKHPNPLLREAGKYSGTINFLFPPLYLAYSGSFRLLFLLSTLLSSTFIQNTKEYHLSSNSPKRIICTPLELRKTPIYFGCFASCKIAGEASLTFFLHETSTTGT